MPVGTVGTNTTPKITAQNGRKVSNASKQKGKHVIRSRKRPGQDDMNGDISYCGTRNALGVKRLAFLPKVTSGQFLLL